MKKKLLSLFLVFAMTVTLLPFPVSASSGTGDDGITWSLENGTLTISGSGPMEDHVPAGAGWGSWIVKNIGFVSNDIYNIVVCSDLARIGDSAFAYCRENMAAEIQEGVEEIGPWAFLENSSMTAVTIPVSVTEIGKMAFYFCDSLTDVYYGGTEAQWNSISIRSDNDALLGANIHFNHGAEVPPETEPPVLNTPFEDVPVGAFYEDPVIWAVEMGITNGTDDTHFTPKGQCTRGQIVTFLWRAQGKPKPASTENPFTDIKEDAFYYDAVLWAVEMGITNGTDATHFAPTDTCTRGQAVTFLWRAQGEPASDSENIFTDTDVNAFYYDAVAWAVENNITNGTDTTHFSPSQNCTRGQIVTFLYRAMK